MPKLAVMLLDNHFPPDRRVQYEADLLAERGIQVRIVAWDRRTEPVPVDDDALDVFRLNIPAPPGGGRRSGLAMLRFAYRVWTKRCVLFANASLLIVHDIYLLPFARLVSSVLRLPLVYDAHEEYARMESGRYPNWFLALATRVESALARCARYIVVPGESRVPRWSSAGFSNVVVLRNVGRTSPACTADLTPRWDVLHAGTLSRERRLDLLLELARSRPDVQIAIAGDGKLAHAIEEEASTLPNVSFLGWRTDLAEIIMRSRAIYYGLDPAHPEAETACPNTLYQSLMHRRPLLFFCEGEIGDVARRHRIGLRIAPTAPALAAAVDDVRGDGAWEFEAAWAAVASAANVETYIAAIASLVEPRGEL